MRKQKTGLVNLHPSLTDLRTKRKIVKAVAQIAAAEGSKEEQDGEIQWKMKRKRNQWWQERTG